MLGATGAASKTVVNPSDYYNDFITVVPAGQTWVSYLQILTQATYGTGNTGVMALKAAVAGATATNWETSATAQGLSDLTISYATSGDTVLTAGAQLYALAQAAVTVHATNPTLFNRVPYTTAVTDWTDANVTAFVTDLTTVS